MSGHKISKWRSSSVSDSLSTWAKVTQPQRQKILVKQRLWRKKVSLQPFSFESKYRNRTNQNNTISNYLIGFLFFNRLTWLSSLPVPMWSSYVVLLRKVPVFGQWCSSTHCEADPQNLVGFFFLHCVVQSANSSIDAFSFIIYYSLIY